MDQFHKSQNAPVPHPTLLHSEQKCAHFCSEWSIVGCGTSAFWDLCIGSIASHRKVRDAIDPAHTSRNAPDNHLTIHHFVIHFHEMKYSCCSFNFAAVCSPGPLCYESSLGKVMACHKATNQYLNQSGLVKWRMYTWVTRPQWIIPAVYIAVPRIACTWRADSMMTSSNGNNFRLTRHLCGEFTGPRLNPHTKVSEAELWCFLWSAPE